MSTKRAIVMALFVAFALFSFIVLIPAIVDEVGRVKQRDSSGSYRYGETPKTEI